MSPFLTVYKCTTSKALAVQCSALCLASVLGFKFSKHDAFEDIVLNARQFAYKKMSPEDRFHIELIQLNVKPSN
jgi:hypothetical protein